MWGRGWAYVSSADEQVEPAATLPVGQLCVRSLSLGDAMSLLSIPTTPRGSDDAYVRSYLQLRIAIGVLGVVLPLLLIVIVDVLDGKNPALRGSVSAYYYTGGRDLFVAAMCVTGVFLIGYKLRNGRKRDLSRNESRVTTAAGVAAVIVALFPTGRPEGVMDLVPIQEALSEGFVKWVHYLAALLFILLLARIAFYFAEAEGPGSPKPAKLVNEQKWTPLKWKMYHNTMGRIIIVAVLGAVVFVRTPLPDKYAIFFAEWIAVTAFGASWIAKGAEWDRLKGAVGLTDR